MQKSSKEEIALKMGIQQSIKREEEEEENVNRWIKHYSSSHRILLVGEGDFSFSTCLASAFGWASNMVATSLDSQGILSFPFLRARVLEHLHIYTKFKLILA